MALTDEQIAEIRERAVKLAQPNVDLIREKLPEATLTLSGDRIGLRTLFQGREIGVTYFDVGKLADSDHVRRVVMGFEGKLNSLQGEFVMREAIKESILDLVVQPTT